MQYKITILLAFRTSNLRFIRVY